MSGEDAVARGGDGAAFRALVRWRSAALILVGGIGILAFGNLALDLILEGRSGLRVAVRSVPESTVGSPR